MSENKYEVNMVIKSSTETSSSRPGMVSPVITAPSVEQAKREAQASHPGYVVSYVTKRS
jgi:hypothetical protein